MHQPGWLSPFTPAGKWVLVTGCWLGRAVMLERRVNPGYGQPGPGRQRSGQALRVAAGGDAAFAIGGLQLL